MKPQAGKAVVIKKSKKKRQNTTFKEKLRVTTEKLLDLKDSKCLLNIIGEECQVPSTNLAKTLLAKTKKMSTRSSGGQKDMITSTPHYTKVGRQEFFNDSGFSKYSPINFRLSNQGNQVQSERDKPKKNLPQDDKNVSERPKSLRGQKEDSSVIYIPNESKEEIQQNVRSSRRNQSKKNTSRKEFVSPVAPSPAAVKAATQGSKIILRPHRTLSRDTETKQPSREVSTRSRINHSAGVSLEKGTKKRFIKAQRSRSEPEVKSSEKAVEKNQRHSTPENVSRSQCTSPKRILSRNRESISEQLCTPKKAKPPKDPSPDGSDSEILMPLSPNKTVSKEIRTPGSTGKELRVSLEPFDSPKEDRTEFVNKTPRRGRNLTFETVPVQTEKVAIQQNTPAALVSTKDKTCDHSALNTSKRSAANNESEAEKSSNLHIIIDDLKARIEDSRRSMTRSPRVNKTLSAVSAAAGPSRNKGNVTIGHVMGGKVQEERIKSWVDLVGKLEQFAKESAKRMLEREAEGHGEDSDEYVYMGEPVRGEKTTIYKATYERCGKRRKLANCNKSLRHKSFIHDMTWDQRRECLESVVEKVLANRKTVNREVQTSTRLSSSAVRSTAPSFRRSAIKAGQSFRGSVRVLGYDNSPCNSDISGRPNIYDSLQEGNVVDALRFSNTNEPSLSLIDKPWRFENGQPRESSNDVLNFIHSEHDLRVTSSSEDEAKLPDSLLLQRRLSASSSDDSDGNGSPNRTLTQQRENRRTKSRVKQYNRRNKDVTQADIGVAVTDKNSNKKYGPQSFVESISDIVNNDSLLTRLSDARRSSPRKGNKNTLNRQKSDEKTNKSLHTPSDNSIVERKRRHTSIERRGKVPRISSNKSISERNDLDKQTSQNANISPHNRQASSSFVGAKDKLQKNSPQKLSYALDKPLISDNHKANNYEAAEKGSLRKKTLQRKNHTLNQSLANSEENDHILQKTPQNVNRNLNESFANISASSNKKTPQNVQGTLNESAARSRAKKTLADVSDLDGIVPFSEMPDPSSTSQINQPEEQPLVDKSNLARSTRRKKSALKKPSSVTKSKPVPSVDVKVAEQSEAIEAPKENIKSRQTRGRKRADQENVPAFEKSVGRWRSTVSTSNRWLAELNESNILQTEEGRRPQRVRKQMKCLTDIDVEALGFVLANPGEMKANLEPRAKKAKRSKQNTTKKSTRAASYKKPLGMTNEQDNSEVPSSTDNNYLPPISEYLENNQGNDNDIGNLPVSNTNEDTELMPPPPTSSSSRVRKDSRDSGFDSTGTAKQKTTGKKRGRPRKNKANSDTLPSITQVPEESSVRVQPGPSGLASTEQNVTITATTTIPCPWSCIVEEVYQNISSQCRSEAGDSQMNAQSHLEGSNSQSDYSDFVNYVVANELCKLKYVNRMPSEAAYQKVGNLYVSEQMKDIEGHFAHGFLRLEPDDQKRLTHGNRYSFIYMVVSGIAQVRLEDKKSVVNAGDAFCILRGMKYAIKNASTDSALVLFYVRIKIPDLET